MSFRWSRMERSLARVTGGTGVPGYGGCSSFVRSSHAASVRLQVVPGAWSTRRVGAGVRVCPCRVQRRGACPRRRPQGRAALPTAGELSRSLITEAKRTSERSWLGEVSAVVLQQSLRDAESAYRNFFASLTGARKVRNCDRRASSPQGRPAVGPVHRQRPLEHHRQWPPEPAEDRRGEGEVVPQPAHHPHLGHRHQGRGRPVLRLLRDRHRPCRRCRPDARHRPGHRHRPGPDTFRRAVHRREDRLPQVPAACGEEAEEGPAELSRKQKGSKTGPRPASKSPAPTPR